jgi:hypothetical protein
MIRFFLLIVASLASVMGMSQNNSLPPVMRTQNTMDVLTNGMQVGQTIYGIPMPPREVNGDFYLDKKWNKTTLLIYENEHLLEGFLTRFDIESSNFEIKVNDGVRVLESKKVKSAIWIDSLSGKPHYFLNAKNYLINDTPLIGLLEVLSDGNYPLFKRVMTYMLKANYNVALAVGDKNDEIVRKEIYYFSEGNKLMEIKRKKELLGYFKDRSSDLESFISKNKLSVSKPDDLVTIFTYINK